MDVYSFDASTIVDTNRNMPMDIHQGIWGALRELAETQRAFMPREAYEELTQVDDECAPWCKEVATFVVDATPGEIDIVRRIVTAHPGWVQERQNAADPWLIANAKEHGRILITQERKKGPNTADHNLKIPNVCEEFGVAWMNLNELARAEGWTF